MEIVISGFGNGVWSEKDEGIDNPTIPTDAELKAKYIKANRKLYNVLFLLTNGEATGTQYSFRAKRVNHKTDGLMTWNVLKKKHEGSTAQRHMELDQKLDNLEIRREEVPDHFFSRLHSIRDQLQNLGEDVHVMRLTALVINFVSRIYEPVREMHYKNDGYSLNQIKSTMSKSYHRQASDVSTPESGTQVSAMTINLENVTCDECGKRGQPKSKCCSFLKNKNPAESSAEKKWRTYHRTRFHNTDGRFTLKQQANATKTSSAIIQTFDTIGGSMHTVSSTTVFAAITAPPSIALPAINQGTINQSRSASDIPIDTAMFSVFP